MRRFWSPAIHPTSTATAAFLTVSLFLLRPASAQSPLFLLDSEVGVSTSIYRVDQRSGQMTMLGSLDIELGEATSLAADGPEVLYVATLLGNLIKVTLAPSFSATTLGSIGGALTAMHMDGGLLYVVDEDTDELSTVQITPLTKTVIGTIRVGGPMGPVLDIIGGDITRDSAGNWFLFTNGSNDSASHGKLYQLDVATAVATEIGPALWNDGRVTGMAVDYDDGDTLYVSARDANEMLVLDPLTGLPTGSVPVCVTCPTAYDLRAGDLGAAELPAVPTATATPVEEPPTATPTPTALDPACVGDCDRDGAVRINELLRAVNIALSLQPLAMCESCDRNRSGAISIDELVESIANALNGCPLR